MFPDFENVFTGTLTLNLSITSQRTRYFCENPCRLLNTGIIQVYVATRFNFQVGPMITSDCATACERICKNVNIYEVSRLQNLKAYTYLLT